MPGAFGDLVRGGVGAGGGGARQAAAAAGVDFEEQALQELVDEQRPRLAQPVRSDARGVALARTAGVTGARCASHQRTTAVTRLVSSERRARPTRPKPGEQDDGAERGLEQRGQTETAAVSSRRSAAHSRPVAVLASTVGSSAR